MQNERKYRTAENEATTKKSRRIIENELLSKTRLSSSYLDVNIGIKRKRKITLRSTNNGEWISERETREARLYEDNERPPSTSFTFKIVICFLIDDVLRTQQASKETAVGNSKTTL